MKKTAIFILVMMASFVVDAQEQINRLLPQLKEAVSDKTEEHFDALMIVKDKGGTATSFSFKIPKNQLPDSLGEQLIAAFEHDLSSVQESDRYQVHKDGHNTLSFSLAVKGKLGSESERGKNLQINNHYFDSQIEKALMLDVEDDSLLTFRQYQMSHQKISKDYVTSPFDSLISEIAQMKDVKAEKVEYILTDTKKRPRFCIFNYSGGVGRKAGIRYEVPKEYAPRLMKEFKKAARDYFDSTQPCIIWIKENSMQAGFDWHEVRFAEMVPDGRLFVLDVAVTEGNIQIPGQWKSIIYYNDGIER